MRPMQEWDGAWDYTSTMILKSAQSYVLRIALGVTGFVPVDELRDVEEWQEAATRDDTPASRVVGLRCRPMFDFEALGLDRPETTERLR
jgi:hypothetical protein